MEVSGCSSMETFILTCLQTQLIIGRINSNHLPNKIKNDLIWEIKQISPKKCKLPIDKPPTEETH